MRDTVRLYLDVIETWKDEYGRMKQVEVAYNDYDVESGELVGVGTEDFSRERYKTIITKLLWTWDGERRNAGGHRWFEYTGLDYKYIRGEGRKVKRFIQNAFERSVNKVAEIELR